MRYSECKPKMCKHRRKVLDLLEFILESEPDIESVFNVFVLHVAQHDEDHTWVSDEQWAEWMQEYADDLLREANGV